MQLSHFLVTSFSSLMAFSVKGFAANSDRVLEHGSGLKVSLDEDAPNPFVVRCRDNLHAPRTIAFLMEDMTRPESQAMHHSPFQNSLALW